MNEIDTSGMLTIPEVRDLTGLTVNTLYNYRNTLRGPPSIKVGRRLYYKKADVLDFVEDRRKNPPKRGRRPSGLKH